MASLMTTKGFNNLLNSGYKAVTSVPTKINIGIGSSTPSESNTALNKKIPIENTEQVDSCDATTSWNASTDSSISVNTTLYKEGTGSLNIYKDGVTGTTFGASKTVSSFNFTDKDLWVFIYVADITDLVGTGTALTLRFGSDSSNYYYYDMDVSTLSNGWNYPVFNTSTATGTTGTPAIAACDYFEIIGNVDLAADTVDEGDFMIDDIKLASETDYDKDFDTDTLVVDENANSVSYEATVSLTQANGYPLTEQGHLNDSEDLYTHNVAVADNKTKQELYIYKETVKLLNTNL